MLFYIPLFFIILICIFLVISYNRIVSRQERAEGSWNQVDLQLKRFFDLIPPLLKALPGETARERGELADAREQYMFAAAPEEALEACRRAEEALGRLFAAEESCAQPLQELAQAEAEISAARRSFNDAVRAYNAGIRRFPGILLAGAFRFTPIVCIRTGDGK